ncbi:unnamed protein product [Symbiodinium necroappetens]|uniref:Uncharacterized protein n=1 Tax=Symbiodinium necroappetens TaxID=1628268 RepID=A0A812IQZ0_9DINO|nr:unnamed protein product [Symbiodinium necroappetens]
MDETSKSAAGVSVLADGLAVSHYVEALEARTPRSPRKTGQAPREVAADVQDVTEAQGTAPDSPPKAEDPLQFGADLELELDSLEAAGPRIALPAPAERADRTDAEQEASPNDFCLSPVAGTGYAAAGFTSLHSLSADLSPVAWARRDEEFQFSPVVLESLAGVQETDPPSETADASAQPPRLHALTPCNVGSAAKARWLLIGTRESGKSSEWFCRFSVVGQLHSAMEKAEARSLVERCLPRFKDAGLSAPDGITDVKVRAIASLWAGMGSVYDLAVSSKNGIQHVVAKRVQLPKRCDSIGDQRKKDSYDVEAAFYQKGHAERLISAGCMVPFPLHVEHSRGEGVTICMTKMEGKPSHPRGAEAFVSWLARLHATYWGRRADEACGDLAWGRT